MHKALLPGEILDPQGKADRLSMKQEVLYRCGTLMAVKQALVTQLVVPNISPSPPIEYERSELKLEMGGGVHDASPTVKSVECNGFGEEK